MVLDGFSSMFEGGGRASVQGLPPGQRRVWSAFSLKVFRADLCVCVCVYVCVYNMQVC